MDKAIEISSKNGQRYQFVEWTLFRTQVETYCWYDDRWNKIGMNFNSLNEAMNWVKELDARYEDRRTLRKPTIPMPQSAYYSLTGYYGD